MNISDILSSSPAWYLWGMILLWVLTVGLPPAVGALQVYGGNSRLAQLMARGLMRLSILSALALNILTWTWLGTLPQLASGSGRGLSPYSSLLRVLAWVAAPLAVFGVHIGVWALTLRWVGVRHPDATFPPSSPEQRQRTRTVTEALIERIRKL